MKPIPELLTHLNWDNKCVLFYTTKFGIICYVVIGNQYKELAPECETTTSLGTVSSLFDTYLHSK